MSENKKSQLTNDEMYLLLLRVQEKIIQMVREGYVLPPEEHINTSYNEE